MLPEEIFYADNKLGERRYNVLLRKVWTDVLYKKIYDEIKLPCALSFKNCKVSGTVFFFNCTWQLHRMQLHFQRMHCE